MIASPSYNRVYLASCLRHYAQIGFPNAQPTSDTLETLDEMFEKRL